MQPHEAVPGSLLVADPAIAAGPEHGHAVSWAAILAGAVAAAALSLILLLLGTGLGLSSISPWATKGIGAGTFGLAAIVWILVTQILASGMGGYLAGRLRAKWTRIHSDETYFRDTAHGFLAWAVATLFTAAMLASLVGAGVSGGAQAGATAAVVAGGAAAKAGGAAVAAEAGASQAEPSGYLMDTLFRRDPGAAAAAASGPPAPGPTESPAAASAMPEVTRIFMNTIHSGALPTEDVRYVGGLVSQRTGLSQPDAERRVNDVYAKAQATLREADTTAREAADKARKAVVYATLWLFVSLLTGAFSASLLATFGGRQRDL